MAIYFVKTSTIDGAPSDTNDGLDPLGTNLSSLTYDDTGNGNGEHNLAGSNGDFNAVQAGDVIHLDDAGSGSITTGLYEVDSVAGDGSWINLTSSAGSDATDVTTSDGPFATVNTLLDNLAAGDEGRICSDGNHEMSTEWTTGTNGSFWDNAIRLFGFNARGTQHVTGANRPTIVPTSGFTQSTNTHAIEVGTFWKFAGFVIDGASTGGDQFSGALLGTDGCAYYDCEFLNTSSRGFTPGKNGRVHSCRISGNGFLGLRITDPGIVLYRCTIHDNNHGVWAADQFAVFCECIIYDNTSYSIRERGNFEGCMFWSCTFDRNDNDAIQIREGGDVIGCSMVNSAGYGINWAAGDKGVWDWNHFYSNTSGQTNLSSGNPGDRNQSGDPLFSSTTDGNENYTPQSGSPLLDNSLDTGSS